MVSEDLVVLQFPDNPEQGGIATLWVGPLCAKGDIYRLEMLSSWEWSMEGGCTMPSELLYKYV